MPEIRQFWLNAARVRTVRRGLSERFTMEGYRSGKSFRLLNRNVHEAAVWALEPRILGEEETERLRQEGRLREIRDGDGTLRETWIRWEETENFLRHGPADRVCLLDANEGSLPLEAVSTEPFLLPGSWTGSRWSTAQEEEADAALDRARSMDWSFQLDL